MCSCLGRLIGVVQRSGGCFIYAIWELEFNFPKWENLLVYWGEIQLEKGHGYGRCDLANRLWFTNTIKNKQTVRNCVAVGLAFHCFL